MKFRHEIKYEINYSDMLSARSRLSAVAKADPYADCGKYNVRSLYFDDSSDTALREKIDGVNRREKFRLRFYNGNTDFIRLEKKSKINGLCAKISAEITAEQVEYMLKGYVDFLIESDSPLMRELYAKMKNVGLRPKTIVEYTREPFVFSAGNVRVTFDYGIRTGLQTEDFLKENCVTIPASDSIVMEVKWDDFLPDIIRSAAGLDSRRAGAFSKYASCRIYG